MPCPPEALQNPDVPPRTVALNCCLARWGVAKLVKAPDFDSGIRGFESFLPSHFYLSPE